MIPFLEGTGRDLSSNLVVFPGKRPAHFLRKSLARRMKGSFIPPLILSMDEFVDFVYEKGLGRSERKLETIDATAVLYDIHKAAARRLGGDGFLTADTFFPLGLKIYRDIEELSIEDVTPHRVRDIELFAGEGIPDQTAKRLQSLTFFYEEFYRRVRERGFSTRSLRYRVVSEEIDEDLFTRFRKLIFGGFFALTVSEKRLFREMLSWRKALFIFHDGRGLAERLSDLGVSKEGEETEASGPVVHFYSSPDTHGQVLGLNTLLRSRIEGGEGFDEKDVVVLPSPESLFPLLRQSLSLLGEESYNVSLGYPLHRTPIFGFFNNLMELISSMDGDKVYVPDYLKFVLHPYTKNIYLEGKSEITRILFHTIEEDLTSHRTRTFLAPTEIEDNESLFQGVIEKVPQDEKEMARTRLREHLRSIHLNTIGKFLAFKDVHDFTTKAAGLITYIFNHSSARLHPLFYPFSESFLKALDVLARSLIKDMAFSETASYFSLFRKYIMTCHAPFEGTPLRGLQVLGFLETRSLSFDTVVILDVNEETIPDTRKDDTLLPLRARQILGLPTYRDRDALIAYYFETLVKGAREVHLFFVENDRKERSRFVEQMLWQRQKREKKKEAGDYLKSLQYRVKLENSVPGAVRKTEGMVSLLKEFTYSATALDIYLKCPLRFYYTYVLGLQKQEEISGEIERSDIGKLVHGALSAYFSRRRGSPLREKDIDLEEMDLLVERLFQRDYGENPAGAPYLLKGQVKRHLRDFLQQYYVPLVREREVVVRDVERNISSSVDSFALRGRIDAIEDRDGRTVIIDYKTTGRRESLEIDYGALDVNRRESWGRAIGSLQLPFYILLYSVVTGGDVRDVNSMFLLLGRQVIDGGIELPLFHDQGTGAERHELLTTILFDLLREIVDAATPFAPTRERKEMCPLCNFRYICGTQWIVR